MSTHPPTLTAEQIIEGCEQEKLTVTKPQLGRWAGAGLLVPPRRKGKQGQGRGVMWVWDAECLPRAIIVARTLQTGDPSLKQAAMELWIRGYVPTSADLLRQLLHHVVAGLEQRIRRRQTYLENAELSKQERRRRFVGASKRRLAAAPDILQNLAAWAGQGFVGLANPSADNVSAISSAISFARLHMMLDDAPPDVVMRSADQALQLMRATSAFLTPVLQTAFERGLAHRQARQEGGDPAEVRAVMVDDLNNIDSYLFLPLTTLGVIALRRISLRHLVSILRLLRDVVREILGPDATSLELAIRAVVSPDHPDSLAGWWDEQAGQPSNASASASASEPPGTADVCADDVTGEYR